MVLTKENTTMSETVTTPINEINPAEWLALEALWATAKTPFDVQWQRWLIDNVRDPTGVPGIVIGGNLQRFNTSMRAASMPDSFSSNLLLASRAVDHVGKMAGGLVGMVAHCNTPPAAWAQPVSEHIATHVAATKEVLAVAGSSNNSKITDNPDVYYQKLGQVLSNIRHAGYDPYDFGNSHDIVLETAAMGVRTWLSFGIVSDLVLVEGATPRSAGEQIEKLRQEFQQHIPIIKAEVAAVA
jgi:hypothetical protein